MRIWNFETGFHSEFCFWAIAVGGGSYPRCGEKIGEGDGSRPRVMICNDRNEGKAPFLSVLEVQGAKSMRPASATLVVLRKSNSDFQNPYRSHVKGGRARPHAWGTLFPAE